MALAALAALSVAFFSSCKPQGQENQAGQWLYVSAASGLRLRSAPNMESERIALIPLNSRVQVLERGAEETIIDGQRGHWMRVQFNSQKGWVFGAFLSEAPADVVALRARERFAGVWEGRNVCEGAPSALTVNDDGRFVAQLFGGCDISGCFCGKAEGKWKAVEEKICFEIENSDFQAAPEGVDPCYRLRGGRLVAVSQGFVENYGSETLSGLQRQ